MRRCAHRTDPFTVKLPGMGGVHFVATSEGAREILTLPREILTAPTPNPIEPIVGPSSVILASGDQDRRLRRMLSPRRFAGRGRADAHARWHRRVTVDSTGWRAGDRVALHQVSQAITKRIIIQTVLGVGSGAGNDEFDHVVSALLNTNTAPLMLVPGLRREFASCPNRDGSSGLTCGRATSSELQSPHCISIRRSGTNRTDSILTDFSATPRRRSSTCPSAAVTGAAPERRSHRMSLLSPSAR